MKEGKWGDLLMLTDFIVLGGNLPENLFIPTVMRPSAIKRTQERPPSLAGHKTIN